MAMQVEPNRREDRIMSPTEAAYFAGFIDGEGTINLRRGRKKKEGRGYIAVLCVANTNIGLLRELVEMCGNGRIIQKNWRGHGQKLCYDIVFTANQIRHVLPQIHPYLRAKRRQSEIVLRYLSVVGPAVGVPQEYAEEIAVLQVECQGLNVRGIDPEEEQALVDAGLLSKCIESGCGQRTYHSSEYCHHHWREHREVSQRDCEYCGKTIDLTQPHRRFCSGECQAKAWYEQKELPRIRAERAEREPGICERCGASFSREQYKDKRFCGETCQQRAYNATRPKRAKPAVKKICETCGVEFQTIFSKQKFCTDACNQKAYRQRSNQ